MNHSVPLLRPTGKHRFSFISLEFLFWAAFAFFPFTVPFLKEKGLDNATIGMIMTINSAIGIFAQPFWGLVSDWVKSVKSVFMFCFFASSAVYMLLLTVRIPLLIGLILAVDTLFRCAVVSLMDTWMVSTLHGHEGISYGSVRLWGSVGFAFMVFIFGQMVNHQSVGIIFPFCFVLAILTLLLCTRIGDNRSAMKVEVKKLRPMKLLKNYHYVTFILFIFLLNIPNSSVNTFVPTLFEHVGGTKAQYGLMHAIKAFAEIPFFLFGKYLIDKYGHKKLILTAAFIYMPQQFLFASAGSILQVMFAQILLGPAYSLFLMSMLYYVIALAPDELLATGQTMASAFGIGLSAMIGNYGGGLFIKYFGIRSLYWTGGIMDLITIVLFIISLVIGKKLQPHAAALELPQN